MFVKREVAVALRDGVGYCDRHVSSRICTVTGDLIENVKSIVVESYCSLQELVNTSARDKFVAFQQQKSSCRDEQISAIKLELEHLKGENIRLQERISLGEARNSPRPDHIASITASQSEIACAKLKANT